MKNNFTYQLFFVFLIFSHTLLTAHGFGCFTYVKAQQGWNLAGQIEKDRFVASYDVDRDQFVSSRVKSAGYSQTNCYFRIGFEDTSADDIQCTPDQIFYVPAYHGWIPACELAVGDELLSVDGSLVPITIIEFVQKPLHVFTFEVEDTHTFFVGSKSVLVHNMLAPFSFVGLSLAFGSGATAGGAGGSFLGPITLVGGVVIGGIVGAAIYGCTSKGKFKYQLDYKPEAITTYLQNKQDQKNNSARANQSSGAGSPSPNDPDDEERVDKGNSYTTNKQDQQDAEKLGYKRDKSPPFYSHNKHAYKKDQTWITADRTGHNGGRWKMFNKAGQRLGTFDKNLKLIGE